MAERAASARAAALRAAWFRWAASADERSAARAALSLAARQRLRSAVRRWLGGARFMRRRRCVEALEFSACAPYGAARVRRLRQRSGWAQWAARIAAAAARGRQRQHLVWLSRRSQLRRGFRCARGGCDWLAASEERDDAAESLRRALGFDRWRRASARRDAERERLAARAYRQAMRRAVARALEVWTEAMYAAYRGRQLLLFGSMHREAAAFRCWREQYGEGGSRRNTYWGRVAVRDIMWA